MAEPFWFPPSAVADGVRIIARCTRCLHSRDLDLPSLAAAGDKPLRTLQGRLRCEARGRDGRQAICGGLGKLEIVTPTCHDVRGLIHYPSVLKPGL